MVSAATSIVWSRESASPEAWKEVIFTIIRPLDNLAVFETASQSGPAAPARFAIRQALDQEYQKYLVRQNADARQARYRAGGDPDADAEIPSVNNENAGDGANAKRSKPAATKRDFFGRIIDEARPESKDGSSSEKMGLPQLGEREQDKKVWVSFHEGFSNAVRKPITLEELMRGF